MDIVIYTNPVTLYHKKGIDEPHTHYFWSLSRRPTKFKTGNRIYFAIKGHVVGYFVSENFETFEGITEIEWNKNSWTDIKPIPTKHFQGFRYRWWNY